MIQVTKTNVSPLTSFAHASVTSQVSRQWLISARYNSSARLLEIMYHHRHVNYWYHTYQTSAELEGRRNAAEKQCLIVWNVCCVLHDMQEIHLDRMATLSNWYLDALDATFWKNLLDHHRDPTKPVPERPNRNANFNNRRNPRRNRTGSNVSPPRRRSQPRENKASCFGAVFISLFFFDLTLTSILCWLCFDFCFDFALTLTYVFGCSQRR